MPGDPDEIELLRRLAARALLAGELELTLEAAAMLAEAMYGPPPAPVPEREE